MFKDKEQSQQMEILMSTVQDQSQQIERLMYTVQDQPPHRGRHGQINQIFPTPFEWKISNFDHFVLRSMFMAEKQRKVSEPFYLRRCGYKYLLTIEIAYNVSAEVLIKVVPGEFDESLSWPCKEKVRVTVTDQELLLGRGKNISGVIDFEKGEEPCSRPLRDDHHDYRPILALRRIESRTASYISNYTLLISVNRE